MSHIFRLYTDGPNHYEDWHGISAFPYSHGNRQNIQDPDGDTATVEITSIPSPFARIAVAKHAFKEVNRQGMDGNTIFHKTVSDILDVGEIFFNYDKLSDLVDIIVWHPQNLGSLLNSDSIGNKFLGMAYNTYMESDKDTYNFDKSQNIYILNYKKGRNQINIIGATSPATLFFSSANDLSYISPNISFITDHPFDSIYNPLYNRDFDYIKSWFIMRASISNFASKFPEIEEYLNITLSLINDDTKRQELCNITASDAAKYSNISVSIDGKLDTVEIMGVPVLMKVTEPVSNSAFEILPTKPDVSTRPLVLPVDSGNTYSELLYTQGKFGHEAHAPYYDPAPLNQRKLPFDGRQQEYLTISDFLEDYIIKVPHKTNNRDFFNPMCFTLTENHEEISYLIPLKETFFEYFGVEDLTSNSLVNIKIERLASDSVAVTLNIPIVGNGKIKTIEYSRRYQGDPEIDRNKGGIEIFDFDAFVMPLIKDKDETRAFYTVSCITAKSRNYSLKFFKDKNAIENVPDDCRYNNSKNDLKADTYSVRGSHFDYIQVQNEDGIRGLILPKFKENSANTEFYVSIDLGTSNTHIEYSKGNSKLSESLKYNEQTPLLSPVFIPSEFEYDGSRRTMGLEYEYELILRDFLPKAIGEKELYSFPTRTVMSCAKIYNSGQVNLPYGLFNLPFAYDKVLNFDYNQDFCNIKWGKDDSLLKNYIECILLMVRNKILTENGDLSKTHITWFFPTSMPPKRKNLLQDAWNELFNKYIADGTTSSMTESSAPIHYLFETQSTSTDVVSIDIGGGTTDVAFAHNKEILGVTSFRFASNSLFEDQLAPKNLQNGIVDYFRQVIIDNLQNSNLFSQISDLFESETHQDPANMAAFMFSLKDNSYLNNMSEDGKDFNTILNKDENFKIVFIIFYTAILYHIGKIIKLKGYNLPRHIAFSGNGSKILNVITTNSRDLADYTKLVLEIITEKKYSGNLEIIGLGKNDNPKTSTCKGGIRAMDSGLVSDPKVIIRADGSSDIDSELTLEKLKGNKILKGTIIDAAEDFLDFVLNKLPMDYKYDFDNHFGVTANSLKIARSVMFEDIDTFLDKGIDIRAEEGDIQDKVEETLFFVPIKGVINSISKNIFDSL